MDSLHFLIRCGRVLTVTPFQYNPSSGHFGLCPIWERYSAAIWILSAVKVVLVAYNNFFNAKANFLTQTSTSTMIIVLNATYLTVIASYWQLSNFVGRSEALRCLEQIRDLLRQFRPSLGVSGKGTPIIVAGCLLCSNVVLLGLYAVAYGITGNWIGLVAAFLYQIESESICVATTYISYLVTLLTNMYDDLEDQFELGGAKNCHSAEFFRLIKLNDHLTEAIRKVALVYGGTVMYLLNGTVMFMAVNIYYLFCVCYYSNEFGGTSQVILMTGLIIWMGNLSTCSYYVCNACHRCSKKVALPHALTRNYRFHQLFPSFSRPTRQPSPRDTLTTTR